MEYSIYRNNILVTSVKPNTNSELSQKKQSEDIVRLYFVLDSYIDIQIGAYIVFEKTNQKYFLNKKPRVVESPNNYQYECIFEGNIHELRKTKVFLQTGDYSDYRFPLTGNAETFLSFIVDNLNRAGGDFVAGSFNETSTITIDFNNWNVFESIQEISSKLGISWYFDGNILNFTDKEVESVFVFQVGRLSGFTSLTRTRVSSENIVTVAYGYGSTENMPPRTATSGQTYDSHLLTENRLAFVGVDNESKLENNVDLYGRIESVQEFPDIKPEFTGIVETFVDNQSFIDTSIDFDINAQLLAGIFPKITFLNGLLIGQTFNISFDNSTKKITMDFITDEVGSTPNDLIKAAVSDQYKIFDIIMPSAYITDAQTRLEEATQAYLDKQSKGLELFDGILDRQFIQDNGIVLNIGDLVRVISKPFEIDNYYEIKELTQKITDKWDYTIKFGDVIPKTLLRSITSANFSTSQDIYTVASSTYTTTQINNVVNTTINESTEWLSL
jgi:hypothetical protein